jgi:DUF4097 and DUF4098 domain-containing protein YvlB
MLSADIEIKTTDGTESTVLVTGLQRMLEATRVELSGDRLLVEMQRKLFGRWGPQMRGEGLRVQICVPSRSRVNVSYASGDAVVDGTLERVDVQSVSGDIQVTGNVVSDAAFKTVSGNVHLASIGGDLVASTVSGDVSADAVGGSVSAKSVSGDLSVGSVREGQVKVQSVSGDVAVGIAAGTNIEVDASSASGVLSSEVPLSGSRGKGSAGPTVVLRGHTVSGDVRLFRAA